jgi:hypothetical protein
MKEQSAVEWLVSEIRKLAHNDKHHLGMGDVRITQGMLDELEEQAKEVEVEKLKEAYSMGRLNRSIKQFNETLKQQQ